MATKEAIAAARDGAVNRLTAVITALGDRFGMLPVDLKPYYHDPEYAQMQQLVNLADWAEQMQGMVEQVLTSAAAEQVGLQQEAEVARATITRLQSEVETLQADVETLTAQIGSEIPSGPEQEAEPPAPVQQPVSVKTAGKPKK